MTPKPTPQTRREILGKIEQRLEYICGEIEAERISYGEIHELQSLADHIGPDDVVLREWAGLPETPYLIGKQALNARRNKP